MGVNKIEGNTATVAVGRIVMNAVRKYEGGKGISLPQLKKILREKKKIDVVLHDSEIKLALKNAMDRGVLSREDGFYKVIFFLIQFDLDGDLTPHATLMVFILPK